MSEEKIESGLVSKIELFVLVVLKLIVRCDTVETNKGVRSN